jgi:hypothetical protein
VHRIFGGYAKIPKFKLEDAKAAIWDEMREKLSGLGLTLKDVLPN